MYFGRKNLVPGNFITEKMSSNCAEQRKPHAKRDMI